MIKFKANLSNTKVIGILLSIICFGYIYIDVSIIIIILAIFLLIQKIVIRKLYIAYESRCFMLWGGFYLIATLYAPDWNIAIKMASSVFLLIIVKVILDNLSGWENNCFQLLHYVSLIFVVTTYFQLMFPEYIYSINQMILTEEQININQELLIRDSCYAGITGQTGTNAFYITLYIASTLALLEQNPKKSYRILLVLGVGALWLTGKRGLLIANVMGILICQYIKSRKKSSYLIGTIGAVIGMIIIFLIVRRQLPFVNPMIEKFMSIDDFTSGRDVIYVLYWNLFKESPIWGNGIGIGYTTNFSAHNIYLKLLAEIGIIGLLIFLLAVSIVLFSSIKALKVSNNLPDKNTRKILIFSVYMQIFFLVYGMTGNGIDDTSQLCIYLLSTSMFCTIYRQYKGNIYLTLAYGKSGTKQREKLIDTGDTRK